MLKQHLDMIGRNEPIQRKAKFWQSYVRALKGTGFRSLTYVGTAIARWPALSTSENVRHRADAHGEKLFAVVAPYAGHRKMARKETVVYIYRRRTKTTTIRAHSNPSRPTVPRNDRLVVKRLRAVAGMIYGIA